MLNKTLSSISFEEVESLADCPYCKSPKGEPCKTKATVRNPQIPHMSRVKTAKQAKGETS